MRTRSSAALPNQVIKFNAYQVIKFNAYIRITCTFVQNNVAHARHAHFLSPASLAIMFRSSSPAAQDDDHFAQSRAGVSYSFDLAPCWLRVCTKLSIELEIPVVAHTQSYRTVGSVARSTGER